MIDRIEPSADFANDWGFSTYPRKMLRLEDSLSSILDLRLIQASRLHQHYLFPHIRCLRFLCLKHSTQEYKPIHQYQRNQKN